MSECKRDRDRATAAFRRWARAGCPDAEEIRNRQHAGRRSQSDLLACALVFALLSDPEFRARSNAAEGREIMAAVRAVYMADPGRELRRSEISGRVTRFALDHYTAERTVYYWLRRARDLWRHARAEV